MFKNRFIVVLGVLSLLLATMAVSQPFSNAPASSAAAANDFYQRHPNWNRNLEASDYYERHAELSGSVASIAGDFALRHLAWTVSVQSAVIPLTGISGAWDYFQRHPLQGLPAERAADFSDYSARHTEPHTPVTNDLSDYFLRH